MITSAAVMATVNGVKGCWPVHRHCDFFQIMRDFNLNYDKENVVQGFIDYSESKGERFVSREDAMRIAKKHHQLLDKENKGTTLFSEDIY